MIERTGNLGSLNSTGEAYYSNLSFSSSKILINKEEGLQELEANYPNFTFAYKETHYVPSLLSYQYELVHKYEGKGKAEGGVEQTITVFVNTEAGEEEALNKKS